MLKVAYPRTLSDVAAEFVGEGQWRLVNRKVDGADPSGLLGFVERVGASYEVLRLEEPTLPRRVGSLREARALLVSRGEGETL
jgi:hypothetical protein